MLIDLALTVPDAHVSHGAQTGDMSPLYWRPGQRSALSIGGNRPNANFYLLDGVTNTDPTFNTMNLSLSPDAVQEFQVQTGSYSAELGGAGGGQVNIVTRQGGSRFHGTGYEFLRNNALDARTWNEMPGTTIFDPSTSYANPNYNPALPVSTSNPQTLRDAFPNNVIPVSRLYPAAALMLKNYVPRSMTLHHP